MTAWTADELRKVGAAEEVQLAPRRRGGALAKPVTIWAVRHGDGIYVRSVRGRDGAWYRGTQQIHEGRLSARGIEKDVSIEKGVDANDEVDAAYRTKYRRYAGRILNSVLTAEARSTTLRLLPRA